MKNVLLIGDSIRLQYCNRVKELLADECNVYFTNDNCRYTLYTLWNLRIWIQEFGIDHLDLVHWNNGIWDHHRVTEDGEPLSTLEHYLYLNRRLHKQMQMYTDRLIWATSIPAGEKYVQNPNGICALSREEWNKEIALYNDVLATYLSSHGVWINDLHGLIGSDVKKYICDDGIHLTEAGAEDAAQQVAKMIRDRLHVET